MYEFDSHLPTILTYGQTVDESHDDNEEHALSFFMGKVAGPVDHIGDYSCPRGFNEFL